MKYNTRIAPSPSGHFHLGTARTAYFNWLAARSTGGKFYLRIDDTNTEKTSESFVDEIFEAMEYLGLGFDRSFRQSERLAVYSANIATLLGSGRAARLDDGAVAMSFYPGGLHSWSDDSAQIDVSAQDRDIAARMIISTSDGRPTYHLASVVDDIDCDINYVIRGVDHIPNTARQITLYRALCADLPRYAHVGLLHFQGKKMSKRDGVDGVVELKKKGYSREAVLNFLLRMGWGPTVDDKTTAIIPVEKALRLFLAGGKMRGSAANVDMAKLDAYDRKYKARAREG